MRREGSADEAEPSMLPPETIRNPASRSSPQDDMSDPFKPSSDSVERRSDDNDYRDQEFYEPVKFGEFGKYMRNKRRKLKVQNAALLEDGQERPQIFKNLRIYVNGFTESITLPELTELLVRHGGEYVPYLDKKGLVTHIIATNLTPSKRKEFAKYKVATPDWLVDSAEQGRLLDWRQYSLLAPPRQGDVAVSRIGDGSLAAEDAARLGTQTGQRSLFSMGVSGAGSAAAASGKAVPPPQPTSGSHRAPPPPSKNVETRESLAERGARLAREALKAQAAGPLHSFFASKPANPASPTKPARSPQSSESAHATARAVQSSSADTGELNPPEVAEAPEQAANLPATTDSPTKPTKTTRSWLPSKERNERTAALLRDADWLAKHTSASPDFLAGYFAQSRLHWISSFKEELKDLIAVKQHGKTTPKRAKKLTGGAADGRTIMHVDFDCFFVSAGLTTRPELRGKPVAVCHARGKGEAASSTSEIASCSYEARASGVKNGMSLGRARELCPDIQTMPFEFELYRIITLKFYDILLAHAAYIQVVSMDECLAEVDVPPTVFRDQDPTVDLARRLREQIFEATGCEASIGISHNILLARLAMRKAKPASIFHLYPEDVDDFLLGLDVDALPGIGWSMRAKLLQELSVKTVADLRRVSPAKLAEVIGPGNSKKFAAYASGVDDSELESQKLRQSVSTEVNYGIRFGPERIDQVERFVRELGDETAKRLRTAGLKARQLVLHVMIRHPDAPIDAPKFLGHGYVNIENRTSAVSAPGGGATDDGGVVGEVAWRLMAALKAPPHELRGVGIQLTKLERDGISVETVHEKGQSKLSFQPRPGGDSRRVANVGTPQEHAAQSLPAQSRMGLADKFASNDPPRKTSPNTLVLTSDSSEGEDEPPRKVEARGQKELLSRTRSRSASRKVEPYIPTMFKPTKRSARPLLKSVSQVSADELRHYEIDPETFQSFDRALQAEILADARRSKPPPGKGKTVRKAVPSVEDAGRQSAPPEIIVLPPSSAEITDSQIESMCYDPVIFRELGKATQLEQIALHHARQARTVPGDRSTRSGASGDAASAAKVRNRPPVKNVVVRPTPRFQGQTQLAEILDRIELWMETAPERPPDRDDVDALGRYVEKCAARERGHNLAQATDILRWWDCLLTQHFPHGATTPTESPNGIEELWRLGYRSVRDRLDRVVEKATGRRLQF
ncbi:hypothetical protein JCM8202_002800 [Rhodotorula sphaerocarpa]